MWQIILAFLCVAYNALLSCQLVIDEWSGYAITHPEGIQRSSYFVSLPMKYGVPLIAANTTLHWLISESIFLVSITSYYPGGLVEDPTSSYYFCGYSTRAILVGKLSSTPLCDVSYSHVYSSLPCGIRCTGPYSECLSFSIQ